MKFHTLTPKKDMNISDYKEILDYSMNTKEIRNIAVTGGYGTGKSSIIESYLKNNDITFGKKSLASSYMQLSLGSYTEDKDRGINNIEEKIISQLINQIKRRKIPQSIFHIKDNYNFVSIFAIVSTIFLLIALIFNLMNPEALGDMFNEKNTFLTSNWFLIIQAIIVVLGVSYIIANLYKKQLDYRFVKRVKFYGSEIEVKDSEHTYFDKYTNDIIYLFLNADKKIFIFEDLDRFEEPLIYEKLVELNTIINKRLKEKDQKIKFMYLIKDDIFESKERTKVFDILIPVIPIVVQGNTFDKLKELMKELELEAEFKDSIIKKLVFYIDDMRLLKNVLNEYQIYKLIINKNLEIDNDKLFSLIVYKNLFPKDFHAFQYGSSYIDEVLRIAYFKIDEIKEEAHNQISIQRSLIDKAKNDLIKNKTELEALHFNFKKHRELKTNGKGLEQFENSYDFFKAIKNNKYEVSYIDSRNMRQSNVNIESIFEDIHALPEFKERFESIENRVHQKHEKEINSLKAKSRDIEVLSTKGILNKESKSFFQDIARTNEYYKYLIDSPYFSLLIFLLREELIDPRSIDYISYFYETNLTNNDRNFIRKIYDREKIDYSFKINDPEKVIEEINLMELRNRGVLNISITQYCIKNNLKPELNIIFQTLEDNNSAAFLKVFMDKIEEVNDLKSFFKNAVANKIKLIDIIFNETNLTDSEKVELFMKLIGILEIEEVTSTTSDYIWTEFKNILTHYQINDDNVHLLDNLMDDLQETPIKFQVVSLSTSNLEYLMDLYRNDIITINVNNIIHLVEILYPIAPDEQKHSHNLTILNDIRDKQVKDNILEINLVDYLEAYLQIAAENAIRDKPELIIKYLYGNDISEKLLNEFFKKYNPDYLISNINEYEENFEFIINWGLYEPNVNNIILISNHYKELPDKVIQKINMLNKGLNFSEVTEEIQWTALQILFDYELFNEDNQILNETLGSFNDEIHNLEGYELNDIQINALIEVNKIKFTGENSMFILNKEPIKIQVYFENLLEKDSIDSDLLYRVLHTSNINLELKQRYLTKFVEHLSLEEVLDIIKNSEMNLDKNLVNILKRKKHTFSNAELNKSILKYYEQLNLVTRVKLEENSIVSQGRDIRKNKNYRDLNIEEYT